MLAPEALITRLIARVRALMPQDWVGQPGERFRKATRSISEFASDHNITPHDLLGEGVELGRRKLEGLANHEFAEAVRNFAEAEGIETETELKRRSFESEVSRKEAEARKAHADARLAELNALQAELELLSKLKKIGVVLHRDERGNLTALPLPDDCDLLEITREMLPSGVTFSAEGISVVGNITDPLYFPKLRVTLEPGASVIGMVTGSVVVIRGGALLEGNVEARNDLKLEKEGKLVGDVRTPRFSLEDGAYFKGGIDILPEA